MSAMYTPYLPAVYSGLMGRTMADCDKNSKPKPEPEAKVNPYKFTDEDKMAIIESKDVPLINWRKIDNDDPDLACLDIPKTPKKPAEKTTADTKAEKAS